jgi:hypothetical protein
MVATATDLLFEELVAYWSIIAFSFLFHGKLLMLVFWMFLSFATMSN